MKRSDLVYGVHPVLEALQSDKTIEKVLLQKGLQLENTQKLLGKIREAGVAIQYVPKVKLDGITRKNHQGVIAFISPIEYTKLEWLLPTIFEKGENPFFLVLDHITDVRNFGAICRSAECAGMHGVIIPARGAAQVNEDAVKTSAGALLNLPICKEHSLEGALKFLKESGVRIVACHEKGERTHYEVDMSQPVAILLGSEDLGISPALQAEAQEHMHIPMLGSTPSLNVSAAAAVVVFEALRQRGSR